MGLLYFGWKQKYFVSENLYWKAIIDIFLIFFSPSIEMNM